MDGEWLGVTMILSFAAVTPVVTVLLERVGGQTMTDFHGKALEQMERIGLGDLYYTEEGLGVMRCMMCKKCGNILPASQIEDCTHPNPSLPALDAGEDTEGKR